MCFDAQCQIVSLRIDFRSASLELSFYFIFLNYLQPILSLQHFMQKSPVDSFVPG